jgi:hypothetical protein
MTGKSRLADLQCVYQLAHAQFPAPESSNNADACRIYDSLPEGGKVSHCLHISVFTDISSGNSRKSKGPSPKLRPSFQAIRINVVQPGCNRAVLK